MTTPPTVLAESSGAIRILTLNRPAKLNALNFEMQDCLLAELRAVSADSTARAVILTGAGKAFCAGGDHSVRLEAVHGGPERRSEIRRDYLATMRCLMSLSVPVIAAVNGIAAGFGAGLVALSDIVIMGEGAALSDPHVKFGLTADTACELMWPRLCSPIIARELFLTGRQVDAREALTIGLANRLCPQGQEMSVALALARELVELPRAGIAGIKRLLTRGLTEQFEDLFAATEFVNPQ